MCEPSMRNLHYGAFYVYTQYLYLSSFVDTFFILPIGKVDTGHEFNDYP